MPGTQGQEALLIVEQFPRQAEYTRNIAHDADLPLIRWLQAPCLENTLCTSAPKGLLVESFAQQRQQSLNLFSALAKLFKWPLPVFFQVTAQVLFLIRLKRICEEIACLGRPLRIAGLRN